MAKAAATMPATRANPEWLQALTSGNPSQPEALGDLRVITPDERLALAEDCAQINANSREAP